MIKFVVDGWTLLSEQISEIFASDTKALLTELAVAGVRFWVANGNFRTVISATATLSAGQRGPLEDFDRPIVAAAKLYREEKGISEPSDISFKILSLIYGAVILVDGGYESADMAADSLRSLLSNEL